MQKFVISIEAMDEHHLFCVSLNFFLFLITFNRSNLSGKIQIVELFVIDGCNFCQILTDVTLFH